MTIFQKLAWFFAFNFLGIVVMSHWPGLTDAQGRLLGLFYIDPIDDMFHLASGILAGIAAWHSPRWSITYFKYANIPYGIDAITGLFFSREFLNGGVFIHGLGSPDFSIHNILVNAPHVIITGMALVIGFWLSKKADKNYKLKF